MWKFVIAAFFYAWIIFTAAADLHAAQPNDDWTQGVAVPTSATDSGASSYTIAGYADGTEFQGFFGIVETSETEEPEQ